MEGPCTAPELKNGRDARRTAPGRDARRRNATGIKEWEKRTAHGAVMQGRCTAPELKNGRDARRTAPGRRAAGFLASRRFLGEPPVSWRAPDFLAGSRFSLHWLAALAALAALAEHRISCSAAEDPVLGR